MEWELEMVLDKLLLHNHSPSHRNMLVEDMKKYSLKNQKPSLNNHPHHENVSTGTSIMTTESKNYKAIISKSTCTKLLWKNPSKVVKTPISVLIYQKINQFLSLKKKEKKETKKEKRKRKKKRKRQRQRQTNQSSKNLKCLVLMVLLLSMSLIEATYKKKKKDNQSTC